MTIYSGLTTRLSLAKYLNNNGADISDYTKRIGDLSLNRILGYQEHKVPTGSGVLLTPDNVKFNLAKICVDREEWVKNNKDELELVEELEKKFVENKKPENK
ncbi:hypothetical protein WJM97_13185 [Okeanomitos corallinicola TIOX110]|uniref:Uncharacterized protein n=1 Tax=Okeanomitos corallinicola TIOX110 TaxID=3133117 RepID=A0ABZ2ULX8_9CYAN